MENYVKYKQVWQWGPGSVVILALLVLWMKPAHAYYICPQPDGTQLITDTPGPGCVKQEMPADPGFPSREKPKELVEKPNPTIAEEAPGEQLDYQGHNKEWWQARLKYLTKEREAALAQISNLKKQYNLIPPHLPFNTRRKMGREIQDNLILFRLRLQDIETLLKRLPEEARKAGAPPGWVRE